LTADGKEDRTLQRSARVALPADGQPGGSAGASPRETARDVAIGALIGVGAIVMKAGLNSILGGETGFVVLIVAALAGAWFAGLRGGLAAILVAAVLNLVIFVGVAGPSPMSALDAGRMILFVIGGLIVTWLITSLQKSRDRLSASLVELGSMAAAIERRDQRLELVLATSGTGFWEWDVRSGQLTWSDTIFRQHGLDSAGEAPSFERYIETIHPDDRERFRRTIEETVASRDDFSLEFRILWTDGSVHWTHGVGRVFRDADGRPTRVIGTGTDITERRRLEADRDRLVADERRAGSFREAFIDVISHELRTPITTIFGLTRILARPGRVDDAIERAGLIDDIAVESERLFRLVEDLLVLTRAERGQFAIEAEPLQLRRILDRVATREQARLPGLTIRTEVARDLPVVAGEETYVEQIVRNMLSNAAKYTPPGTEVIVRAEQEGGSVMVRVLDSGPGIDPATADRAFELFYRSPDRARSVAGSGIGLFVCASLVEAMGGEIWARSRPEGGAEFGFTLRVLPDDENLGVDRPEPAVAGLISGADPD
jgi:PAS domain S-box-containing protein